MKEKNAATNVSTEKLKNKKDKNKRNELTIKKEQKIHKQIDKKRYETCSFLLLSEHKGRVSENALGI